MQHQLASYRHKDKNRRQPAAGFTIVELMIAVLVFSLVLLVCSYAIIHVGRMYYKGVIISRTQDVSRKVVEDIAGTIQFGPRQEPFVRPGTGAPAADLHAWCVGTTRYTFSTGRHQGAIAHVLYKDTYVSAGAGCPILDITQDNPPGATDGESLLGRNMRVPQIDIQSASGNLWHVTVRIAYGDDNTLFEGEGAEADVNERYKYCKGVNAGGQFCATSTFETSVVKRLL